MVLGHVPGGRRGGRSVDLALDPFVLLCRRLRSPGIANSPISRNVSRHLQRTHNGYTLAHAGPQMRIGPVGFWIVVGTLMVMAVLVDRDRHLLRLQ